MLHQPCTTHPLLELISGHGLVPDRHLIPPTGDEWENFLIGAEWHGLTGLLARAVETGDLDLTGSRVADVHDAHRNAMRRTLLLDASLVEVTKQFVAHGIDYRCLKGSAHAHLLYPDASLRTYVDVDLLVTGEAFGDAAHVLTDLGMERTSPELRPGFDREFGKGATFRRPGVVAVDLHRTLIAGPYAFLIPPDMLFSRRDEFFVAGRRVAALGAEERCIHACIHGTLSDQQPKLISVRDVVQCMSDPRLDNDRLRTVAVAWRATALIARATTMAQRIVPLGGPNIVPAWLADEPPSRRQRFVLRAYDANGHRWRRQALAAVPFVHRGGRFRYFRAVLGAHVSHR